MFAALARDFVPHDLHAPSRVWVEKNCYIDVWINLSHVLGLDPHAMLGPAAAVDFVDDQWTFLKPSHDELREFYGLRVQELTAWRPLAEHTGEHLARRRLISVEADAWWLPDTAATDYRRQHTKTTIVILHDDPAEQRLVYLHNTGCHELTGEDYRQTMANGGLPLPLYAEWIDTAQAVIRSTVDLRRLARQRLAVHLAWRADQPVRRFQARCAAELQNLQRLGGADALARYHAWAFATTRQFGIAAELLALHAQWLDPASAATAPLMAAAQAAKGLILKGARAVASGRPLQADELFGTAHAGWTAGLDALVRESAT